MTNAAQAEAARVSSGPGNPSGTTPAWSPEMEALLACVRSHSAPPGPEPKLSPALDGERLLREAGRHGMSTLLRHWLAGHGLGGQAIPISASQPGFSQLLEERYHSYIRQGLKHTAVLVEVMELLRGAGITALPYKGPVLSSRIFGDPALREAVDLDILLPSDQVPAACGSLAAVGFERIRRYAPGIEKQLLRYRAEIGMMRDGVLVELQWRLAPQYFSVPLDVRALAERATRMQVAGADLPALAAEDDLLVLCVHGAKHHWQSLKWLLDVALVIRTTPTLSWPALQHRAQATGTLRLLYLGLSLCEALLQTSLPSDVSAAVHRDPAVQSAADGLIADMASNREPTEAEHHRLMLRLRERFSDRARYLFRLGWQPTESEWESVALPPALHFAYHGVRVGRVLAKVLRLASA